MRLESKLKEVIKARASPRLLNALRNVRSVLQVAETLILTLWGRAVKNWVSLWINARKSQRYLEIGPGKDRLPGFETLDLVGGWNIDYVWDAAKRLPFKDNTFDLIYASHVLEHIPWYMTEQVLKEWVRVLKPGGWLEVWVPDGLKICKTLVEAETGAIRMLPDGWTVLNPREDPFLWVNGRIFYGTRGYPSWHRAIFTARYLKELFERVGLVDVRELDRSEVRGYDHGWINLGIKGRKP